ncbi:hypothetical protein RB195_022007 [Necator americanus]|uniref:Uncharacterized protein n=1 Tax=Necator americanus TaxID=51031 RepID=A0ABR1EDL1_NECAM
MGQLEPRGTKNSHPSSQGFGEIKKDLREIRGVVLTEAADAEKSIREALQNLPFKKLLSGSQKKQPWHREGKWKKLSTTSTLTSSTAVSGCHHLRENDMSF